MLFVYSLRQNQWHDWWAIILTGQLLGTSVWPVYSQPGESRCWDSEKDWERWGCHQHTCTPAAHHISSGDGWLLSPAEKNKKTHTWNQQDCTLARSMNEEINTLNLTWSKNSRFTRSSSGQLSIMRVLRVLIRSCLHEAKDMIMPQKAVKWPPNEKL